MNHLSYFTVTERAVANKQKGSRVQGWDHGDFSSEVVKGGSGRLVRHIQDKKVDVDLRPIGNRSLGELTKSLKCI